LRNENLASHYVNQTIELFIKEAENMRWHKGYAPAL